MKAYILHIPTSILIHVAFYLGLKDILELAESHAFLKLVIYKRPEIWTSDILFPINDSSITDSFIQQIIPRITRLYGVTKLTMLNLPLGWMGYLLVFDQFAHTVKEMKVQAALNTLLDLNDHLCTFAGNLLLLQQSNQMPISFRQYAFDDEQEYASAFSESGLSIYGSDNLYARFKNEKLHDPPFEQLECFDFTIATTDRHSNQKAQVIERLNILFTFLSSSIDGNKIVNEEAVPSMTQPGEALVTEVYSRNLKRPREETLPPISTFDVKCLKLDDNLLPF